MSVHIKRLTIVAVSLVATACGGTSTPTQGNPAGGARPAATGTAVAAPAGECFVGAHAVRSITGHQAVDLPQGPARPVGTGGSLTLDLGADGRWTLSSDGSAPAAFQVGSYSATIAIDGSLQGTYAHSGTQFAFSQDGATGTAVVRTPAGASSIPISSVGPALAPGGLATITCGQDAVRLDSASVTMDLAGASGGTAAATATPAAPPAGGELAIDQSGATRTDACGGRSVLVTGSSNHLALTGDCPRVEIDGSNDTVTVERVDTIAVTGSFDHVTWHAAISRSQPAVATAGQGDVVSQG
jgi:Protein of unknown function (DUF3060)